jgi:hypothetical protein
MSLDPETERRILQCVDEVLEALGKSEAQIFISYLARSLGLKKKSDSPQARTIFQGAEHDLWRAGGQRA